MQDNSISKEQKASASLSLPDAKDLLDIMYIVNALLKTEGNVTKAAEKLDIGRRTIYELMEKYGILCGDGKISIELRPVLQYIELCAPRIEKYLAES